MTDDLIAHGARPGPAGPSSQERHPVASFPGVALHAAQLAHRTVSVLLHVFREPDRAVVTGKDHERAVRHLESVERVQHLANGMIHLVDEIAVHACLALPQEGLPGKPGRVRRCQGKIKEERLLRRVLRVVLQVIDALPDKFPENFAVLVAGRNSPFSPERTLDSAPPRTVARFHLFTGRGHATIAVDIVIGWNIQRGRYAEIYQRL